MNKTFWIVLIVANLPVYFLVGRVFFKDLDEFFDSVAAVLRPE